MHLTKMMKENAATQEELDSNAQERRQTTMLASPPLSGFAAFQSEAVKVRKTDRRRREAGAGRRVAGTGIVRTVEDTVFPSR